MEIDSSSLNTLVPGDGTVILTHWGQDKMDDIFKGIFLNENVSITWIMIKILLKFVAKGPINNIPALV